MSKHLFTHQHLIEDQPSTPDITFLVVLLQFQHLRSSVEGSAGSLGHLDLDISRQTEVSQLQLFVFVQEDIVRLEISVEFVCMDENLLSLLI